MATKQHYQLDIFIEVEMMPKLYRILISLESETVKTPNFFTGVHQKQKNKIKNQFNSWHEMTLYFSVFCSHLNPYINNSGIFNRQPPVTTKFTIWHRLLAHYINRKPLKIRKFTFFFCLSCSSMELRANVQGFFVCVATKHPFNIGSYDPAWFHCCRCMQRVTGLVISDAT